MARRVDVDDVVAALSDARDFIAAGMWCQRTGTAIIDGRRCYCATAALAAASPSSRVFDVAMAALVAVLPVGYTRVSDYNDAATRTNVVALFTAAIGTVQQAVAA
jgi:hypothetical protein